MIAHSSADFYSKDLKDPKDYPINLFSFACWNGSVKTVEYFIENGGIRIRPNWETDYFKDGVSREDREKINDLIKRAFEKKLFKAVEENNVDEIRRLLELGVDVNVKNDMGSYVDGLENNMTPLIFACLIGNVSVITYLLKHPEIKLNKQKYDGGRTALHATIESEKTSNEIKLKIIDLFITNKKVDLNNYDSYEFPLLFCALGVNARGLINPKNTNIPIAKKLLTCERLYLGGNHLEIFPIAVACEIGVLELVENIIDHPNFDKVDLDTSVWRNGDGIMGLDEEINQARDGLPLISIPCATGDPDMLVLLDQKELDFNINYDLSFVYLGSSPIVTACMFGRGTVLLALLRLEGIKLSVKEEDNGRFLAIEEIIKREVEVGEGDPTYRRIQKLVRDGLGVLDAAQIITDENVNNGIDMLMSIMDASGQPKVPSSVGKLLLEFIHGGTTKSSNFHGRDEFMASNKNKRQKLNKNTENNGGDAIDSQMQDDEGNGLDSDNDEEGMSIGM